MKSIISYLENMKNINKDNIQIKILEKTIQMLEKFNAILKNRYLEMSKSSNQIFKKNDFIKINNKNLNNQLDKQYKQNNLLSNPKFYIDIEKKFDLNKNKILYNINEINAEKYVKQAIIRLNNEMKYKNKESEFGYGV